MADNNNTMGLDNTKGLFDNPMDFFASLPEDVRVWIVWILSFFAFVFLVITLLSFFAHGIGAGASSLQKDGAGRNNHTIGILFGLFTLVLVIIAVAMVLGLYT